VAAWRNKDACMQLSGKPYTLQIYRSFEIGRLIKLIMLDTRIIGRSLQNISAVNVSPRAPPTARASYTSAATPAACSRACHAGLADATCRTPGRRPCPAYICSATEADAVTAAGHVGITEPRCNGMLQDPSRTILGAPQKAFLQSELLAAEGKQRWKVLGQQVRCKTTCNLDPMRLQACRGCIASRCT
jgi:phosphodiesterase/alkaline phosphatase D-like protein